MTFDAPAVTPSPDNAPAVPIPSPSFDRPARTPEPRTSQSRMNPNGLGTGDGLLVVHDRLALLAALRVVEDALQGLSTARRLQVVSDERRHHGPMTALTGLIAHQSDPRVKKTLRTVAQAWGSALASAWLVGLDADEQAEAKIATARQAVAEARLLVA